MFFDKNLVTVNGNIARINAFYTKNHTKGAYVIIGSQNGQDNNGNDRTNWIEFQAWGDKAQNVADVYRYVKNAPKGHKKVSAYGHIRTWQDSQNHTHMNLILNRIGMAHFNSKKTSQKQTVSSANHSLQKPAKDADKVNADTKAPANV